MSQLLSTNLLFEELDLFHVLLVGLTQILHGELFEERYITNKISMHSIMPESQRISCLLHRKYRSASSLHKRRTLLDFFVLRGQLVKLDCKQVYAFLALSLRLSFRVKDLFFLQFLNKVVKLFVSQAHLSFKSLCFYGLFESIVLKSKHDFV